MTIHGIDLDGFSRCKHYHSEKDIVAIKMKCCGRLYACIDCHNELEDHLPDQWPRHESKEKAIFCGNCKRLISIKQYIEGKNCCPHCEAAFNSRCEKHYPHYFNW